ncbi:endonuclease/exonuclease/phosphatase family protein [Pseudonocardia sp. N23]|uniref:endonuclease/exonuclease/phosphatase family protein n=1 Tax=Pseudonocardia sp. N23 TaxID=1987376 RepID=UPI00114564A3|nr:endonuclease/exonuclease/phosphatase family protein [Pseudonocardia sp. N23]
MSRRRRTALTPPAGGAELPTGAGGQPRPRSPRPRQADEWRTDVGTISTWCSANTPTVVAGDLNSTFDQSVLRDAARGCDDAATQRGQGLTPTWGPGGRTVGPQIDHVLATSGIEAESVRFLDLPGSDHRAVLVRLVLPTGQPSSTGSASTP